MSRNIMAFTLIELLVVIAIIGLLATMAVVSFGNARAKARDAKRLNDLKQISLALELYYDKYERYPFGAAGSDRDCWKNNEGYSTCHPLGALVDEGIMASIPVDPGSNSYKTTSPCEEAQFYAYSAQAADGQEYYLGAVQETKSGACECDFGWGEYQACIHVTN